MSDRLDPKHGDRRTLPNGRTEVYFVDHLGMYGPRWIAETQDSWWRIAARALLLVMLFAVALMAAAMVAVRA